MHYAIEILDHDRGNFSDVGPVFAGDNRTDASDALLDTMTGVIERLVEEEGYGRESVEYNTVRMYAAALDVIDLPGEGTKTVTVDILPSLYAIRFHRHPANDCDCQ